MTTLTLNPAAAAARRAAKAASAMPAPAAEPPTPTSASPATGPNKHGRLKAELDALEAKLRRIWPHCFTAPVPLAIGIRYDIAPHLSADEQKLLPGVLHRWVKRRGYLNACVQPGAHRVGLDGSLTPITPEQAAYAREKLAAVVSERASMSIIITNDGNNPEPGGEHGYILKINQREIARFTHRREDGLAKCLIRAAAAAAQAEYKRQARIAMELLRG